MIPTDTFLKLKREKSEKTAFNIAKTVYEGIENYNLQREKGQAPDYNTLPTKAEELWERIQRNEKPIGDCWHRSIAVEYALKQLGIRSVTVPVFATVKYLSRGKAPEHVHGVRTDHFITRFFDENGNVKYIDSGRTLEDVEAAFKSGELEFPSDAFRRLENTPTAAKDYTWKIEAEGRKLEGKAAIMHALSL